MRIGEIASLLDEWVPPVLQEGYDNCGLLTGDATRMCTGIIVTLDVTPAVISEAVGRGCNLVVSHHPVIFKGLKKLTGASQVEETVISAIENKVALYAIHTNLDNVLFGVNGSFANRLSLENRKVLLPRRDTLVKLVTFVPHDHAEQVRKALFAAGAGQISDYSECSFNLQGEGTFKPGSKSDPFVGETGQRHTEPETRVEVILPAWQKSKVLTSLRKAHPYEEVAYFLTALENVRDDIGLGIVGELPQELTEEEFLQLLKVKFDLKCIRHTAFTKRKVRRVALCGGSGSFLLANAQKAGAQAFVTGDVKYHDFFDAEGKILLADIGHFESEQFTIELLVEFLQENLPNFAVLKSDTNTNPINYFI